MVKVKGCIDNNSIAVAFSDKLRQKLVLLDKLPLNLNFVFLMTNFDFDLSKGFFF